MKPKGFHLRKEGRWWVVAPLISLTPIYEVESMEGIYFAIFSFMDKRDAEAKMFELMSAIDKEESR